MDLIITKDKQDLERLEGIVDRCLDGINALSLEGSRAIKDIRDRKLYEKVRGVANFETYCRERWGLARQTTYQMIDYVEVIDNVRHGGQNEVVPENERQARPLSKLEPAQQREAWQQAVETAPDGKVTAAHVCKIVNKMTRPDPPRAQPKTKTPDIDQQLPSYAIEFAIAAISHLERISKNDPNREAAFRRVEAWIRKERSLL